jgi:hypothetical protein
MAYTDGVTLEVEYTSPPAGNTFSYAAITTSPDYPEENQIIVRWEMVTVETPGGDPVQTKDLTASVREQIYQLDSVYLTFNPTANTVTVDGTAVSGATVTVNDGQGGTVDYVYPDFTLINDVNPIKVRRSTNVSNPLVSFQPGSRLTSGQLNAATTQLLYAAQEQSIFGTSTDSSSVDLGSESINNLGDVNINLTNSGAILTIGNDGVITDSTTGGLNEVLSVNGETGNVVLDYTDVGADPAGTIPTMDLTELDNVDTTNISPAAEGDTIGFDGVDYAARRPVEIAAGSGVPDAGWINAAYRQVGDLYIRYED